MHFFLCFFHWKMSKQDDALSSLMLISSPDSDIIPSVCPYEVNSVDARRNRKFLKQ